MRIRGSAVVRLFLITLAFYLYTLAPSLTWGDGVRLQMEVALGGSTYLLFEEADQVTVDGLPFDRLGVAAWDHPLYVMLGQLFLTLPWGDLPFRVNLMSAVAAALTVALTYRVGLWLANDHRAAMLGALALAVSHTFWLHAVMAEVYTLHLLFMISIIELALHWSRDRQARDLMLFALLAGLGLATHVMLVLTLLPAVSYMIVTATADGHRRFQFRSLFSAYGCVALFLIGFAPWWIQFLRMARLMGVPLTAEMAAGSPWLPGSLAISSAWSVVVNLIAYLGWLTYQFTPIGIAVGLVGFVRLHRAQPRAARFLAALFVIHVAFSANYSVTERFAFHLPSYLIFALFIISGMAGLLGWLDTRWLPDRRWLLSVTLLAITLIPVAVYAVTPPLLRAMGVTDQRLGIPPIGTGVRDVLAIFLDPNQRGDDSAARFGRSTLEQLAPHALVLTPNQSDGETYLILRYFQLAENLRRDVHFELMLFQSKDDMPRAILALARSQVACRPIYLASLNPSAYPVAQLQADFDIVPQANIYRLRSRRPQSVTSATCPELDRSWVGAPLEQLIRSAIRWR